MSKKVALFSVMLLFVNLLTPILIIEVAMGQQSTSPTIGEFSAPEQVYLNQYFFLKVTINNPEGLSDFKNATVELSGNIILLWDNDTDSIDKLEDPSLFCTLDNFNSEKTALNATAYCLNFRLKFNWGYRERTASIVYGGTQVFNSGGEYGKGEADELFMVENELTINNLISNVSRTSPRNAITISGEVTYSGTSVPPLVDNSALNLQGINNSVQIDSLNGLELTQAISIEFWTKLNSVTDWGRFIAKSYPEIALGAGGKPYFLIRDDDNPQGSGIHYVYSTRSLIPGTWYHIVGTYDGSNLRIYVNTLQNERKEETYGILNAEGQKYSIGANYLGKSNFIDGVIDEVRIYNRALSFEEVAEHYQGVYTDETGLVLHLNFDGDCLDSSSKHNHGILTGSFTTNDVWVNGYANIHIIVELENTLKKDIALVNSTSGAFKIQIETEPTIGQFEYVVYTKVPYQNEFKNETITIILDRLKISEYGSTRITTHIGEEVTLWYKAMYEFGESEFNSSTGRLYLNGSAMEWSAERKQWEYVYRPETLGLESFLITDFSDQTYNLPMPSNLDEYKITIDVLPNWYDPIINWITSLPFSVWVGIGLLIVIIILIALGLVEVELVKSTGPATNKKDNR